MALVALAVVALAALLVAALHRGSVLWVVLLVVSVPIVIVLLAQGATRFRKRRAKRYRDLHPSR
jgi:hypothetical protein